LAPTDNGIFRGEIWAFMSAGQNFGRDERDLQDGGRTDAIRFVNVIQVQLVIGSKTLDGINGICKMVVVAIRSEPSTLSGSSCHRVKKYGQDERDLQDGQGNGNWLLFVQLHFVALANG
jgi:hypothetical protein